ncbi:MAG TPA: DNA alkylation repair protein [Acidimicrobiia bacterium]|nr:DNA alkylation repair protein [Acidimicrobiia bacterium]
MEPDPPTADELADRIAGALAARRRPELAPAMAAYMRDQFPFLGVKAPDQQAAFREAMAGLPRSLPEDVVVGAADRLWARPEREHQQVGCRLVARHTASPAVTPGFLGPLERLLTTRSWWDTVDSLATHAVGDVVRRHPGLRVDMDRWLRHGNVWLVRSSLLHMHRWKGDTDQEWLFAACLLRSDHPDFFVRKAIGWALREHSKTDAPAVVAFVEAHADRLSGLSRREALVWLERRRGRESSNC